MPERWNALAYLVTFVILVLIGLGITIWNPPNWSSTIRTMGSVIIVSTAITYVVREGIEMLAEQFKRASRKEGRREIIEEVRRAAEQGQSAREVLEAIEKRESDNK